MYTQIHTPIVIRGGGGEGDLIAVFLNDFRYGVPHGTMLGPLLFLLYIIALFKKHASSGVQMPTDICVFRWGQSS